MLMAAQTRPTLRALNFEMILRTRLVIRSVPVPEPAFATQKNNQPKRREGGMVLTDPVAAGVLEFPWRRLRRFGRRVHGYRRAFRNTAQGDSGAGYYGKVAFSRKSAILTYHVPEYSQTPCNQGPQFFTLASRCEG